MIPLKIQDKGDGWKVYGEWHGKMRVVFIGYELDPWLGLKDCMNFVKDAQSR